MSVRTLPARPDLDQLKHQAKDLLRAFRSGDPLAIADFAEHHPVQVDASSAQLADAQLALARSYGASSWPELTVAARVIDAVSRDDFDAVREIISTNPDVLRDRRRPRSERWRSTLSDVANMGLRRTIEHLQANGVRGVAQAMERPGMQKWLDVLRLLGRVGAQPPRDAVGGAVEILNGTDFAFMAEVGAEIRDHSGLTALALETSARNPKSKHQILGVMAEHGVVFPDTPPMALHRGRIDLLEQHLRRDPELLTRTFAHREIWPPELQCHADEVLALHGAPLAHATLLHMATDYEELEIARWLIERGMDVNVRAEVDASGFGGHTPLFNCVVTYNARRRNAALVHLLLEHGADPNARASIRKSLPFARDTSLHEYRDVAPIGWGRRFHDQSYVCQTSMQAIAAAGGRE
jgi:hypothetical protein